MQAPLRCGASAAHGPSTTSEASLASDAAARLSHASNGAGRLPIVPRPRPLGELSLPPHTPPTPHPHPGSPSSPHLSQPHPTPPNPTPRHCRDDLKKRRWHPTDSAQSDHVVKPTQWPLPDRSLSAASAREEPTHSVKGDLGGARSARGAPPLRDAIDETTWRLACPRRHDPKQPPHGLRARYARG